jgi:hypothetical protein
MGTQTNHATEKTMDFQAVDYDASTIAPDAAVGEYDARIDKLKIAATSADKYPMLIVDWKILSAGDEDNETSVNAVVSDFLTFFPEGDRRGRMGKLKLRQLCEKLDIDLDVVPTRIASKSDFDDLIAALKGQTATVWVTHTVDKNTGETRCNVNYVQPRPALAPVAPTDDDDAPAKGKKAAPPAKANKARR